MRARNRPETTSMIDWVMQHPVTVVVIIELGSLGVMAYMVFGLDSRWRRNRIAEQLLSLAEAYPHADDPESRRLILNQLEKAIRSQERFRVCYALVTTGHLMGDAQASVPSEDTRELDTIALIGQQLSSTDQFVRHAAACALFHARRRASSARTALENTVQLYPDESAASIARVVLKSLG
jgi:hypothetical protein